MKVRDAYIVEAISANAMHGAPETDAEREIETLAERMTGVAPRQPHHRP